MTLNASTSSDVDAALDTSLKPVSNPCLPLLLNKDRFYPIFYNICSRLDIASIVALTRTCKGLSTVYQELLDVFWDVNCSLQRFVKNIRGFRSQLRGENALISGSFVLQFLDRVHWPESDLDIYVSRDTPLSESLYSGMITYLIENEGYEPLLRQDVKGQYGLLSPLQVRPCPNTQTGFSAKVAMP